MRRFAPLATLALGLSLLGMVSQASAQDATPVAPSETETFTLVEHALNVTVVDVGEPGPSAGDITVWGPDPLFDEANETDTSAVTQGSCFALNADYDNHCYETVLFPDGSTIAIQGVQLGNGGPSVTTIVGGSGRYLGATGTVTVTATEDDTLWTKIFEVVLD
jgi:hypothetical protein